MRKPKLPKKPKAPKQSASVETWKRYSARLDAWKKKCAAKMKPYNDKQKVIEAARKKAAGI